MKNKVFLFFMMLVCICTTSFANEGDNLVVIGQGKLQCENGILFLNVDGNRYEFNKRNKLFPCNLNENEILKINWKKEEAHVGLKVTCFGFRNLPQSVYDFVVGYKNEQDIYNLYYNLKKDAAYSEICSYRDYKLGGPNDFSPGVYAFCIVMIIVAALALGIPGDG